MAVLESHHGYYLWNYLPSQPAAGTFAALFILATATHSWKIYSTGTKFCTVFVIGCLFEAIGYIARATAYNQTASLMPYIIQNLFILVAPALFAASIYMTLGRIIRSVNAPHLSLIKPTRLTKTFVLGDVASFMVQCGSAGLMFQASTVKFGEWMVIGGLGIQIVMFGLFTISAMVFQSRLRKTPTTESFDSSIPWKQSLHMLYTVSLLIMIRSIFRVVEYVMGQNGYPLKHEWTLYVFDAMLMFLVTVVFYIRFPSELERRGGDIERVVMVSKDSGIKA